jgi:hypothetical protein
MNRAKFKMFCRQFPYLQEAVEAILEGMEDEERGPEVARDLHSVRVQWADGNLLAVVPASSIWASSAGWTQNYRGFAAVYKGEVVPLDASWEVNQGNEGRRHEAMSLADQLAGRPPLGIVEVARSEDWGGPVRRVVTIHRVDPQWMVEVTRQQLHALADQLANELELS